MSERVAKLQSKGMISWEFDGVLARLTKKQSARADVAARFGPMVQFGGLVAMHMRNRVQRGQLIDNQRWKGYSPGANVFISKDYEERAGVRGTFWHSSRAFHRHANPTKLFSPTGGMWKGLTSRARGSSDDRAVITFDGTSPGRGLPDIKTVNGRPKRVIRKRSVRNWFKAGAIFHGTGFNVIQNDGSELTAMSSVIMQKVADEWGEVMPEFAGQTVRYSGSNHELESLLKRRWR